MGLLRSLNLANKRLSSIFHSSKKLILTSVIPVATVLLFSNATVAEGSSMEEITQPFNTIYHVYYGEEKAGIVDNKQIIKNFENEIVAEVNEEYEEMDFSLSNEIKIIPELVFSSKTFNNLTLYNLKNLISVQAESYEITIDDEVVGHVARDEEMDEFEESLILEYVDEEELEQFKSINEDEELDIENIETGDSIVKDIRFSEELAWERSTADPDDIMTVDQVLKMIKQGTLEEEIYTVKKGDVLGKIASKHDLSIDEIIQLNPEIDEDTLLQIGDELNVTVLKPMVDVIVEKVAKKEEKIPYDTETKEDSSMWKGNTKVTTEGKEGKKVVEYAITYENGRSIEKDSISEEILSEPTNKVVVKGTKTSPSRGSGSLSWPTVGGYISSYQGYRWGSYHKGIDIARPSNYAILAADNGTVASAGWENSYGYTIVINHNNGMKTRYAHLSSIHVNVGQTVGKGQQIGRMGSTGNSTGVHLHFEVYKNGALKNPMDYLR